MCTDTPDVVGLTLEQVLVKGVVGARDWRAIPRPDSQVLIRVRHFAMLDIAGRGPAPVLCSRGFRV